jgi:uncharacterized protein (TIGR02145 family)
MFGLLYPRFLILTGFTLALTLTFSCSSDDASNVVYGTPVAYQGETYETVVIGEQTWMARNLNYEAEGSMCYNKDPANCKKYGRLYSWATAMGFPEKCNYNNYSSGEKDIDCKINAPHRGICPEDWHIPSQEDWRELIRAEGDIGKGLKARSGWDSYTAMSDNGNFEKQSGNGTDSYGFAALPGGSGNSDSSFFSVVGEHGYWWSTLTEYDIFAYTYNLNRNNHTGHNSYLSTFSRSSTVSIRCIKD